MLHTIKLRDRFGNSVIAIRQVIATDDIVVIRSHPTGNLIGNRTTQQFHIGTAMKITADEYGRRVSVTGLPGSWDEQLVYKIGKDLLH
jgi:hypothetical protein